MIEANFAGALILLLGYATIQLPLRQIWGRRMTPIVTVWADKSDSVVGYMCLTDFEFELGSASGGNSVYPSVSDIKAMRRCVASCGIVEVEVRFRRIILPAKGFERDKQN